MSAELLDISLEEYFELDAFSQSTAKVVLSRSPAHARAGYRKKPTTSMEAGDIVHKLLLGKGKEFVVINSDSFRTKVAQQQRDDAREKGLVPVLVDEFEAHNIAAEKIRIQLADRGVNLDGVSEQPFTWTEETEYGPVLCKGMLDHVWLDVGIALDLKTTADASPIAVERIAANMGYDVQWAAYTRGLAQLLPQFAGKHALAFAFCELENPHAVNFTEPDGNFQQLGTRRWLRAVTTWAKCIRDNHWPAYGTGTNPLTAPGWALYREEATQQQG